MVRKWCLPLVVCTFSVLMSSIQESESVLLHKRCEMGYCITRLQTGVGVPDSEHSEKPKP